MSTRLYTICQSCSHLWEGTNDEPCFMCQSPSSQHVHYPSVTSILSAWPKPGLPYWYGKLGNEEAHRQLEAAGVIGTLVHQAISALLLGEDNLDDTDWPEGAKVAWQSFLAWKRAHEVVLIKSEAPLFSHDLAVAGRLDFLGRVDGQLEILDFKTGGVYQSAFVQGAVYGVCAEAMGWGTAQAVRVLQLAKVGEPGYVAYVVKDQPPWVRRFQAVRQVWEAEQTFDLGTLKNGRESTHAG